MNWATIIVLIVVLALVVLAIRGLRKGNNKCSSCKVDCPLRGTSRKRHCEERMRRSNPT